MHDSDDARAAHGTPAFAGLTDLASIRVGGRVIAASDEFFAPKTNLVKAEPAIFLPGKFTSRGKWMDGWESRRRRTPGHDWCVIRLGIRGRIAGVDVDTSFFTGNFPSHGSIDVLDTTRAVTPALAATEAAPWTPLVPRTELAGDTHNFLDAAAGAARSRPWTHVRLNIYPDGGVARIRVYGEAEVDWRRVAPGGRAVDLAAVQHGGRVLGASNMHFGGKDNMIMPGRARNMGDGWETRRRRGPGYDWAIVRLGHAGVVRRIELDTNHFKGNYPDSASIEACFAPGGTLESLQAAAWAELLPQVKLRAHHRHVFSRELASPGPVTHVRLNIFPDGGVSRLRIHGTLAPAR